MTSSAAFVETFGTVLTSRGKKQQRNAMARLHHTIGVFYDRVAPLGIAFVGPPRLAVSFGRPPTALAWLLENAEGFVQRHIEDSDVSV
jgi:hypothetical protein